MKKKLEIISLCEKNHLDIWRKNTNYIPRYIKGSAYTLIVPKNQLKLFKKYTNNIYNIKVDENFISKKNLNYLKAKFKKNKDRINWIKQNLIKLEAGCKSEYENILIWDADTVPIKNISFFSGKKLKYYTSKENELSYHTINKKLLNYESPQFSFISQCIITKVSWMKKMKLKIQKKFKKQWITAIIDLMDIKSQNPISEYELIGVFNLNNFKHLMKFTKNNWSRFGYSLTGSVENLDKNIKKLSRNYDYISFEKWEKNIILRKYYTYLTIFTKNLKNFFG